MATVFDYGAKGDGVTDDSGAFRSALAASLTNQQPVLVPAAAYKINSTIQLTINSSTYRPWGLVGQGATLISGITNGTDLMQIVNPVGSVVYDVRYLQISNLKFEGSGALNGQFLDGYGLRLIAQDGQKTDIYDCAFEDLIFDSLGADGMMLDGNIFETSIEQCNFQRCTNGLSCMHDNNNGGSIGVCSSISVTDCMFIQNRNYGLQCGIIGTQFGGCTDVTVTGGYFRQNGNYGAYWNNGMSRCMEDVGFEDNCTSLAQGNSTGAHVYAGVNASMKNCTGWVNNNQSNYLLRVYAMAQMHLVDCGHNNEGNSSPVGLVLLGGTSSGFLWMEGCNAPVGLAYDSGNAAVWRANNCTGTSPIGNLNETGQVGTV